jgi:two-component system cell cycle response regulator
LLDVSPALGSGLDVCRTLRRSLRFQRLPVVVIGASDAAAMRVPAYQAGASDVVSKQLAPEELAARLGVRLELAGLLEAQAEKDALTGLLNLRSFLEASERALARARRMIDPVSLALLDIDALRAVNTGFGHAAGDDVIAQLGRLVHERFRASDLRCRWAGGQFALLFDGAGKLDIMAALQRLLADFAGCSFQADRGAMFRATLSAGVAAFPEDGESLHALLVGADQRLCRAKRQGQGQLRNAETSPPRAEAS